MVKARYLRVLIMVCGRSSYDFISTQRTETRTERHRIRAHPIWKRNYPERIEKATERMEGQFEPRKWKVLSVLV